GTVENIAKHGRCSVLVPGLRPSAVQIAPPIQATHASSGNGLPEPLSASALASSQPPVRKDMGDGKIVLRPLQAVPVAELPLLLLNLEQARDHAFARVDIAAVDDV